jgi:hypothetical protein
MIAALINSIILLVPYNILRERIGSFFGMGTPLKGQLFSLLTILFYFITNWQH